MRGDVYVPTVLEEVTGNTQTPAQPVTVNEEESVANPGSVWWLALIGVLYLVWDWYQTRDNVMSALEPSNVRANLHNLIVITLATVIGVNAMNVFLQKIAGLKIPYVSRLAAYFVPLFNL